MDVRLEHVVKVFDDFRAVDGVDLYIHEGELFSHNFLRGGTIVWPHRDKRGHTARQSGGLVS